MSDPHADDYCVCCSRGSTSGGPVMHPVAGVDNGYVCKDCIDDPTPTMEEYQEWTQETAIGWASTETIPAEDEVPEKWRRAWVTAFLVLALNGESGELAEKAKRVLRGDGDLDALEDEIGDVFWYLARLADELDVSLAYIAAANMEKLEDRSDRGVIAGSGDDR